MSRAKWKFPLILTDKRLNKETSIFVKSRNLVISPSLVNIPVHVYNGKIYHKIFVLENMIGHKFGEFSPTKKNFTFKKRK